MNTTKKGRRAEYRARRALELLGYVVTRSAGSRGAADLIALKGSEVLVVQVKAGKPAQRPEVVWKKDFERLRQLPIDGKKELWWWVDHQGWIVIPILQGPIRPGQIVEQIAGMAIQGS